MLYTGPTERESFSCRPVCCNRSRKSRLCPVICSWQWNSENCFSSVRFFCNVVVLCYGYDKQSPDRQSPGYSHNPRESKTKVNIHTHTIGTLLICKHNGSENWKQGISNRTPVCLCVCVMTILPFVIPIIL